MLRISGALALPEPRSFSPRIVRAFWAAAVATALAAAWAASALAGARSFMLILAVGVVACVAVAAIRVPHSRDWDGLSPLGLVALFFLTSFVFGGVYAYVTPLPDGQQPYESSNVVQAIGLAAIGLPMLVLGYRTNVFRAVLRAIPRLPSDMGASRRVVVVVILLVVGWAARAYVIGSGRYFYQDVNTAVSTGSSWLLITLATLPLLATTYVGATYYLAKRVGRDYGRGRWQFYGLVVAELAYGVPTGSRAAILTVMMMIVVLRYYGLRRRPSLLGVALLSAVAILVVFPFFSALRNANSPGSQFQYHEDLRGSLDTTTQALVDQSPAEAWDAGTKATLERFAGASLVASMLHAGPETIPRAPGETLSWSFTGLLPRAIAPNKPDPGAFTHEFGQALGLTAPGDTKTSLTVTFLAELYFNYRLAGVIVGMFLVGAVYRVIGDYFIGRQRDAISLALYAASAWPLINAQEAIIAVGLIGIIKGMAVLALVLVASSRLAALRWSRT